MDGEIDRGGGWRFDLPSPGHHEWPFAGFVLSNDIVVDLIG